MRRLPWGLVIVLGWLAMVIGVYVLFAAISLVLPDLALDNDSEMTLLIPIALTTAIAIVLTVARLAPVFARSHRRICAWGLLLGPIVFFLAARLVIWY